MTETFKLYRLELEAGLTDDDQLVLALRGILTEKGREAINDPEFKELIDAVTLAASKVLHEHAGEDSEISHRGRATESPAIAEHLAAVGSVAMDAAEQAG